MWWNRFSTGEDGIGQAFCGKGQDCSTLSVGVRGIGQIFWLIGPQNSPELSGREIKEVMHITLYI